MHVKCTQGMIGESLPVVEEGSEGGKTKMGVENGGVDGESGSSPMDMRKAMAFCVATYFLVMTAFIVPLACVSTFILLYPLQFINMQLFLRLENRLCKFVNDHWVSASLYAGLEVVEYGDRVEALSEKRVLYLANHLGLVDHFVIMNSLHDKGTVSGRWMWVIYNIWKYTPLGAMWMSHGNFFVNGGPTKRERLLETFRKHLRNYFWSWDFRWIVMYPEGSRLFMIRDSSARFALKEGLTPLTHCAYPRIGAAHAVMQMCAPSKEDSKKARCGKGEPIEYIVDATLGYPKGVVPDMGSALMGEWPFEDRRIAIHYKVHKVLADYADEDNLKEFLYERYREKEASLDSFYKTGQFEGPARTVQVNNWTIALSQVFWLVSYYIHYTVWFRPLSAAFFSYLTSFIF